MAREESPAGAASPGGTPKPALAGLGIRTPTGWVPLPAEQALPPPVIPDYTVLRRIGGGAYGEVWLARNLTGSHFAIKVVYRHFFDHDRPYERKLTGIQRFEPISRSHPSQVAIHHVGLGEGYFYYAMDLADDAAADSWRPEPSGQKSEVSEASREESPGRGIPLDRSSDHARPDPISDLQSSISNLRSPTPAPLRPINPDTYLPKTLKHLLRTSGRRPFAECLDIALALATALEHLHGHDLVHRDIKPSNVIFVGGVPKLADIGLVTSIDATQSFVGTEGFFPPEGPGTAQADIYSLGKLLYEIATGKDRREFPRLPSDLPSAEEQAALSELNAVILKCCHHDPAQRYRSAAALRAELEGLQHGRSVTSQRAWQRRWGRVRKFALPALVGAVAVLVGATLLRSRPLLPTPPSDDPSQPRSQAGGEARPDPTALIPRGIFVLPMRPAETSGAPVDLCMRITDAFIDSLGLLTNQGLRVGPRKSGWACQEEGELLKRVASEPYRMRHALSGRVGLAQDRYALVLTWHDLELGKPLWSESFSGGTNELIELEQRALLKVVRSLDMDIAPEQSRQIARLLTNNLAALGLLQQAEAVYTTNGTTQEASNQAQRLAREALRLDSNYVGADYFDVYMLRNISMERNPAEALPSLMVRLDVILSHDDTHAGALDHKTGFTLSNSGDWETFDALHEQRLQSVCGRFSLPRELHNAAYLRAKGRFAEARIEQARSEEPEPTNLDHRYMMAASRWADRHYEEGIRITHRTLEMYPRVFDGYLLLAHLLVAKGDYPEGIKVIEAAQAIYKKQELIALLGYAYAKMGQTEKAREVLKELLDLKRSSPYLNPYFVARVYAALGEKQTAIDWLEKAADDRSEYPYQPDWGGLRTDPAWDELQNEPRYWKLCDRLRLGKQDWPR